MTTLHQACHDNLLNAKWLLAPSLQVGHQWIETLVRNGHSAVNLHPKTITQLAMDIVAPELVADGLTLANRFVGPLVVEAAWERLNPDGYLGRLERSSELSNTVFQSLMELRLADCGAPPLDPARFETRAKAADLDQLLDAYLTFLEDHHLVDEADVFNRAIAKLGQDPQALDRNTRVLIPGGLRLADLEQQLLEALPTAVRCEMELPTRPEGDGAGDPSYGARVVGESLRDSPLSRGATELRFFRAVGEVNEVREVLRRCLADQLPLDEVEILHTDSGTYVPLIYAVARRYSSEPDRPDGVPVTFAEGIPAILTRPGRALVGWLDWIRDDYPQRRLVEMVAEGLFSFTVDGDDDEELSFGYLAKLLRPIAIGLGADNYLRKLDEQIKSLRDSAQPADGTEDEATAIAARQRKRKGLLRLRRLIKQLMDLSEKLASGSAQAAFDAAEIFLKSTVRGVNELDKLASETLIAQLTDRRVWLEELKVAVDVRSWLTALPSQTRVLSSGPRPGHLHVAHLSTGGHSGRQRTFVIGLDDRRFPGAVLQDPILLDRERERINAYLPTSAARAREKIDEFSKMLARLAGLKTLCWPCHDLADDRETFPSSAIRSVYRLVSGQPDADLVSLHAAVGPPASFAPETAEKSLDESERWLWQLTDAAVRGTDQLALVESHFPHLARGREAERQRSIGFGSFNGYVPAAGYDLDPFASNTPVLSASALETAGRCPLAYFFRSALALYPLDELAIDPDRWLTAAQFGLLLHDVFRRFMDELSRAGRRPEFERDHGRLAEILHDAVEHWRREIPSPNENAFRVQCWQLTHTCRIFLQAEEDYCRSCQPRYFEVAIGLPCATSKNPLDDVEPATIVLTSGKRIRVRGQIDRVDETSGGQFAVWDYKVGSGYGYDRTNPFREGRRVQSLLYLRMIESALRSKIDARAVVETFGYFFPSVRAQGLRMQWPADALAAGEGILERLCTLIGGGVFLATNNEKEDCNYCDYSTICRDVKQVAGHSKTLMAREDLVMLEPFRELRRG